MSKLVLFIREGGKLNHKCKIGGMARGGLYALTLSAN